METTASLNNLWNQILALPADDRRWLRDKLDVYEAKKEEEHLTPYTIEEINTWIDEAEADFAAGRYLSAEEADREVREALPWLK